MTENNLLNQLVLYDITTDSLLELLKDGDYIDFKHIIMSKDFLKSKPDLVAKLIDLEKRRLINGRLYKYKITFIGQLFRLYGKRWISFWSFIVGVVSLLISILLSWTTDEGDTIPRQSHSPPIPSVPQATYDSVLHYQTLQKKKLDSLTTVLDDLKTKQNDTPALKQNPINKKSISKD